MSKNLATGHAPDVSIFESRRNGKIGEPQSTE
jgi:hypothetical protein